jgi:EmrB/QacA subfamily drug resistance transporter
VSLCTGSTSGRNGIAAVDGNDDEGPTMDARTISRRRWWALGVLCLCLIVIGLDNTILNVAIPSLERDLEASTSQLQWIIDAYTIVFAGLLLTMGALGDRFGRRGALMAGLAVFGVGSLLSGLAQDSLQLTVCRAMMGIGAALIMPATLSLISTIFPDPRERARAIGVWAAVASASSGFGPVLGGWLLQHFSWHAVFLINVPVVVVTLVAGRRLLPTSRDSKARQLDLVGSGLSIVGLMAVLWAIIEAPVKGWSDPVVMAALGIGAVVISVFFVWEHRSSHPMLDLRFFRNPRFSAANVAITLMFFAMFGQMFLVTQYLQSVLGFTALEAGLRLLPLSLLMLLVAPLGPRLVEYVGTKLVVGCGMLLGATGLAIVATVPVDDGYPRLLLGFAIGATGMALTMAPVTESIMGSLPPGKVGVGSAMNDTTRQMGGALGIAVLGSIFASYYRPAVSADMGGLGLSSDQLGQAQDSIGGALQVASQLPGQAGEAVVGLARTGFVDAMSVALLVAAGVVVLAALVVFAFLPARAGDAREGTEGPLDGLASAAFAEAEGQLEVAASELAASELASSEGDGWRSVDGRSARAPDEDLTGPSGAGHPSPA